MSESPERSRNIERVATHLAEAAGTPAANTIAQYAVYALHLEREVERRECAARELSDQLVRSENRNDELEATATRRLDLLREAGSYIASTWAVEKTAPELVAWREKVEAEDPLLNPVIPFLELQSL